MRCGDRLELIPGNILRDQRIGRRLPSIGRRSRRNTGNVQVGQS
jgi:hypothetical protein